MSEKYHDREWLREQYIEKDRTMEDIGDECGVSYQTISRHLKEKGIISDEPQNRSLSDEDIEEIGRLWENTSRTGPEIAEEIGTSNSSIHRIVDEYDYERHYDGSVHVRREPRGYEEVVYKYGTERIAAVYVHRLVAVAHHGMDYLSNDIVHHVNGVKWDNRLENLEVMSRSEHQSHEQNFACS